MCMLRPPKCLHIEQLVDPSIGVIQRLARNLSWHFDWHSLRLMMKLRWKVVTKLWPTSESMHIHLVLRYQRFRGVRPLELRNYLADATPFSYLSICLPIHLSIGIHRVYVTRGCITFNFSCSPFLRLISISHLMCLETVFRVFFSLLESKTVHRGRNIQEIIKHTYIYLYISIHKIFLTYKNFKFSL